MGINLESILLWGLFATGLLTLVMAGSQQMRWSRMSLTFMVGSLFTARRSWATITGTVAHVVLGCAFAILYALVFESWGRATRWLGALLGLYHGLFILVVGMSVLANVHPRMASKHHGPTPTRQLEPPASWRSTTAAAPPSSPSLPTSSSVSSSGRSTSAAAK